MFSALPPLATDERTLPDVSNVPIATDRRRSAPQQTAPIFDHLVGAVISVGGMTRPSVNSSEAGDYGNWTIAFEFYYCSLNLTISS